MFHLLYTSHAVAHYTEKDLIDLLKKSREFNFKNRITGLLLYLDRKFIQVLEGDKEKVLALYEKIRRDPHHTRVTTVVEGASPTRIFKKWSMGFKSISVEEFGQVTGFQDIDKFFVEDEIPKNAHLLLVLFQIFYKKNIVDYAEI